jgi:hypothetical protein
MIALAGAMRSGAKPAAAGEYRFAIRPRWDLATAGR